MKLPGKLAVLPLAILLPVLLFLAACGGDDDTEKPTAVEPTTESTAGPTREPTPGTSEPVEGVWTGNPIVQAKYGLVKGFEDEANTWVWKAIPFAKPPVADLRWKAPQDPDPWEGVREETEFSEACPQYDAVDPETVFGSEDCLYLNVWRPQSEETKLPVYVWVHGGGNSAGWADYGKGYYYGADLSSKANMVYVSVHYRLGPLGWFTHSALRTGDALDDSGNYGTLDLIKSLEWIQKNIEAFGGDPDNVILSGESAGGINIFSLLISPPAKGLFHKAIVQSGTRLTSTVAEGKESARAAILKLLINDGKAEDETGAGAVLDGMPPTEVAAYLRSKTATEILKGYKSTFGGLLIAFPNLFTDGTVLPEASYDTLDTGTYPNKVPLMVGTTKEEYKLFAAFNPALAGKEELSQIVASYGSQFWKANAVDETAMKLSSHSDQPAVYCYQFLWGSPDETGQSVLPGEWGTRLGAVHSIDVPFFLADDTGPMGALGFYTEENRVSREALTDAVVAYQAAFARTGDPNASGSQLPEWKPWSSGAGEPKCILLDADRAGNLRIQMTTEGPLTRADVEEAMRNDVPEPLYSEARALLAGW